MISNADVRRIALSFPGAEEKAHMGHPDFRVRNKIFATLQPKKRRAVVKLTLADQSAVVAMDPEAFSLNSWSHQGWTGVDLKHVTKSQFRRMVESSWRNVAPRTLVREFEAGGGSTR